MNEPVHIYQNSLPAYDVSTMTYCPVCNGYYGVPHINCLSRAGCQNHQRMCACRKHMEAEGRPRQGTHGWIVEAGR